MAQGWFGSAAGISAGTKSFWIDPGDEIAIIDFDVFLPAFESSKSLQAHAVEHLKDGWPPTTSLWNTRRPV